MTRYRVRVTGVIDLDEIPGIDPLDPRPAGEQLEGVTTALFLRYIDAWQHLTLDVIERVSLDEGRMGRHITTKHGHGGWYS